MWKRASTSRASLCVGGKVLTLLTASLRIVALKAPFDED